MENLLQPKAYNDQRRESGSDIYDSFDGMVVVNNKRTLNTDTGYTGPKNEESFWFLWSFIFKLYSDIQSNNYDF